MKKITCCAWLLISTLAFSQPAAYTIANAHSHNDYEKPVPFWAAYNEGFGSIEADIFLQGNELIVAHDEKQVALGRTLDSLYLQPLQQAITKNKGSVYADSSRYLQLMIDIKTAAEPTLAKLVDKLKAYPSLLAAHSLRIVISGNRPAPDKFSSYPAYIYFDGELNKDYPVPALDKIEMLSDNFADYSSWHGAGKIKEDQRVKVEAAIRKAHSLHKKVRFWNAPDVMNAWYYFMHWGVDYINTDHIKGIGDFLKESPDNAYTASENYKPYQPTYRNDGTTKPVKNIILLIGDGTGLPQLYAGYTANKGALNVFNMHFTSLSKTSSYDNYITDSAPGSTAFSSGVKTNNHAVGVDHTGKALTLLPDIFKKKKIKTGIVTSGDITDATPADFYAHQIERSSSEAILNDLLTANVDLIMGEGSNKMTPALAEQLAKKFTVVHTVDSVSNDATKKWMVTEKKAGRSMLAGRDDWAQKAFDKSIQILNQNKNGFFLMLEGAQIDYGGHENKLPYVVTEVMDFDQVIGKAMQFADSNGETLIIVTADHETGGLTLTGGDYAKGYVSGHFSTNEHTAIPVPVFAYGPGSQLFTGVYENTEVFNKILKALQIKQ